MNINKKIKQLQMALLQNGRSIQIDRIQRYSEKAEKIITIYKVYERVWSVKEEKNITKEYCSTTKNLTVLLTLVDIYKGGE